MFDLNLSANAAICSRKNLLRCKLSLQGFLLDFETGTIFMDVKREEKKKVGMHFLTGKKFSKGNVKMKFVFHKTFWGSGAVHCLTSPCSQITNLEILLVLKFREFWTWYGLVRSENATSVLSRFPIFHKTLWQSTRTVWLFRNPIGMLPLHFCVNLLGKQLCGFKTEWIKHFPKSNIQRRCHNSVLSLMWQPTLHFYSTTKRRMEKFSSRK